MIFVDGLGMRPESPKDSPINSEVCPHLVAALQDHAKPIDACLGVPGLPQSATGQTALLTGINAPQIIGRHVEGFPGPKLREIVQENSIFKQLNSKGLTSTFANGYLAKTKQEVEQMRVRSVTTVAALDAFGDVRRREFLERHKAVSHDITRHALIHRGYTGELITPEEGAKDLSTIASAQNFTLFEFFETDRAGHAANMERAKQVLQKLDLFIDIVLKQAHEHDLLVILTSDHGNLEDLSVKTHTQNPVPFLALGPGEVELRSHIQSLTDVTPALINYLSGNKIL